jgi:hypothetical protein
MAGFSMDAHRKYRNGCEKNRGMEDDIVTIDISTLSQLQEPLHPLN